MRRPELFQLSALCRAILGFAPHLATFVVWKNLGLEVPAGQERVHAAALELSAALDEFANPVSLRDVQARIERTRS